MSSGTLNIASNQRANSCIPQTNFLRDPADTGYGTQLVHSVTLDHKIVGELDGYIEYVGSTSVDLDQGYASALGVLQAVALFGYAAVVLRLRQRLRGA